jgi:hypothetical protein
LSGGLLVRLPFEIAEDQGSAVFLGELVQLVVEHPPQLAPGDLGERICLGMEFLGQGGAPRPQTFAGEGRRRRLPTPMACGAGPCVQRQTLGDRAQPAADRIPPGYPRPGLAGQDQERRLNDVLGLMLVTKDAPAGPEHPGAVALHERRERRLLAGRDKTLQKRRVGHVVGHPSARPPPGLASYSLRG